MFLLNRNTNGVFKIPIVLLLWAILPTACGALLPDTTTIEDVPKPTQNQSSEMETGDGPRIIIDDPGIPFDLAQKATDFQLLSPAYFPETFEFLGVSVTGKREAALNYLQSVPTQRLAVLVQTIVGTNSQFNVVMETQNAQIVTVNETDAIWIYDPAGNEGLLDWTINEIRYRLVGITDLEEALRIAESLE